MNTRLLSLCLALVAITIAAGAGGATASQDGKQEADVSARGQDATVGVARPGVLPSLVTVRCKDGFYAPKNGGYGLMFVKVRVRGVSCGRGVKLIGAYTASEPLPAGWTCRDSRSGRTKCSRGRRYASGVFNGDAG